MTSTLLRHAENVKQAGMSITRLRAPHVTTELLRLVRVHDRVQRGFHQRELVEGNHVRLERLVLLGQVVVELHKSDWKKCQQYE